MAVPAIKNLGKSNGALSASRQLLDAVGRARQLAIANHTTVYMVFVPTSFWNNPTYNLPPASFNWLGKLTSAQLAAVTNLCDKQLSGYTFIAYGAVGDQPGQHTWHYLEPWQSLPDNSFIAAVEICARRFRMACRRLTCRSTIRFPARRCSRFMDSTRDSFRFRRWTRRRHCLALPCIAFNYLGQLTFDGQNPASQDEYIPLARGSVLPAMDPSSKVLQLTPPLRVGNPPGNSTNSAYNLVDIDPLTGRATLKFQKVQ